jgi:flavin prenyltransferase
MARIVVCISGASGVVLAHRLIEELLILDHQVDCIVSRDAWLTMQIEMGEAFAGPVKFISSFTKQITLHAITDFRADIASGSAHFDGCVVVPCSMATLGAIAMGLSDNLIRRVSDVALKEKRRLVLVPREAPLHEIHLENMLKLARMGASIYPPEPAWYLNPKTIQDVESQIVSRILDQLGIKNEVSRRWAGSQAL